MTKAQILDAVREAKGADAADRLAGLKKAEMAKAAEDLLAPTGWVPAILRIENGAASDEAPSADAVAPLADECADGARTDESPGAAIAAE